MLVHFYVDKYEGSIPGAMDTWVFASDASGKTIAVKQVTASGFVDLPGSVTSGLITVTKLTIQHYINNGSQFYSASATSYQSIPVGTVSDDALPAQFSFPGVKGKTQITVSGYNDSPNPFYGLFFDDGFGGIFGPVQPTSAFPASIELHTDPSDIIISGYRDNIPVYNWFKNVKINDQVSANWQNFTPCKLIMTDKKLKLFQLTGCPTAAEFPIYTMPSNDLWAGSNSSKDSPTGPRAGYIEGLDHYYSHIVFDRPAGQSVDYFLAGPPPSGNITYPDYTFQKSGTTDDDLSFSLSVPYTYKRVHFYNQFTQQSLGWEVYALPDDKVVIPDLPQIILSKYPGLTADKLALGAIEAIQMLLGPEYVTWMLAQTYPANLEYRRFVF